MDYLGRELPLTADEHRRLEERMASGDEFTLDELAAAGLDRLGAADRTIHNWRRKGWIEFRREGRSTLWSLTEKGLVETVHLRLEEEAAQHAA